jgi:serine/threonine protein kinase
MHRHDIIHRDLKPENVILHCGVVKICDFGWAAYVHDGLRDTFCGTPLYVSPEVLEGVKYGGEVDLWGVGVMAYEMLVGRVPFRIDCERDLHKIVRNKVM